MKTSQISSAFWPSCLVDLMYWMDVNASLRARSFIDIQKRIKNLLANVLPSRLQPVNLTGFIGTLDRSIMKVQKNIPLQSNTDTRKKSGKAYATGLSSFLKLVGYKKTVSAEKRSTPVVPCQLKGRWTSKINTYLFEARNLSKRRGRTCPGAFP